MKVEINYKGVPAGDDVKVVQKHTFIGITSIDLKLEHGEWYLMLNDTLVVTEFKKLDGSIDRIHIAN